MKQKIISRTTAVNKIEDNKGKFFGLRFLTKNGGERYENVHTYTDDLQTKLGYLRLQTRKGKKISAHPLNLLEINIAKGKFKIRKGK